MFSNKIIKKKKKLIIIIINIFNSVFSYKNIFIFYLYTECRQYSFLYEHWYNI